MIDLEDRLRKSSAAIRQGAEQLPARDLVTTQEGSRRGRLMLAFAGAVVAVALLVGIAVLLRPTIGDDDVTTPTRLQPPDTTALERTDTTTASAVVPEGQVGACLDADVDRPARQADLPEPVAAMRDRIIAAALACDADALVDLGGANLDDPFTAGSKLEPSLREIDQQHEPLRGSGDPPVLEILLGVLDTPPAEVTFGDGSPGFVWPAAAVYDTWEEVPTQDLDALESVYPDPQGFAEHFGFDSYSGWWIGISVYGDWLYLYWGPYVTFGGFVYPECPADVMAAPGPQEDLPEPVAEMREQIIVAAKVCDFETLQELAGPDLVHDEFIVEQFRQQEGLPRSSAVDLLERFMGDRLTHGGCGYHRWPNQALACEPPVVALLRALGTTPAEDVVADLEPLTETLDLPGGEFSGLVWDAPYSSWQVGITPDGDWRIFLSGFRLGKRD
jgi:hypothetical protein